MKTFNMEGRGDSPSTRTAGPVSGKKRRADGSHWQISQARKGLDWKGKDKETSRVGAGDRSHYAASLSTKEGMIYI